MKQPINEIKRMQRLAGLITESEYLKESEKTEIRPGVFMDDEGNITTTLTKTIGTEKPFGSKITPAQPMSDEEKQIVDTITQELINMDLLKDNVKAGDGKMYGSAFVKSAGKPVGLSYEIPGIIDQIAQTKNLSGRAVEMYKKQFGSF